MFSVRRIMGSLTPIRGKAGFATFSNEISVKFNQPPKKPEQTLKATPPEKPEESVDEKDRRIRNYIGGAFAWQSDPDKIPSSQPEAQSETSSAPSTSPRRI